MFSQLFESLLITLFNWVRCRWSSPALRQQPVEPSVPPPDHVALGRVIASPGGAPDAASNDLPKPGMVTLSPAEFLRHLYVLGATGCGKTNLLMQIIEADIASRRAFCAIDLRGDLIDRILIRMAHAAPVEEWRTRLLLIDLRQSEHIVGFNPLAGEGTAYNRALHVLSVLKQQSESWGIQLEETLRNCLIALAESGWSLLELEPLLSDASFRAAVVKQVSDPYVRAFFARFEELSPANQLSWAMAVLNKVTPLLAVPELRLMVGQRQSFSFRTLLDSVPGMSILIALDLAKLHEAACLTGGLFVSAFQTAIMSRTDQKESERVPAHLYLDEFENMASDRFESIVAEGRRFGLGLCLSHQNVSQLSPRLRSVLRNNVHTQIYFQTGALDAAELAREITGVDPEEDVRTTLITQKMGEAYVIRRGEASLRIKTLHSPDPDVDPEVVKAMCEASFATYARPASEVEQELKEREQQSTSLSGQAGSDEKPPYEIRHADTTQFKPKDHEPQSHQPRGPSSQSSN